MAVAEINKYPIMFNKVQELKGLLDSIVWYNILIEDLQSEDISPLHQSEILYRQKAVEAYRQRIEILEQYYIDIFDEIAGLN